MEGSVELKYDKEVLSCLNTNQWKTSAEIYSEISDRWLAEGKMTPLARFIGIFSPVIAYMLSDASLGGISNSLSHLERQEMVESRNRYGTNRIEWRRRPGGRRAPSQSNVQSFGTLQTA